MLECDIKELETSVVHLIRTNTEIREEWATDPELQLVLAENEACVPFSCC